LNAAKSCIGASSPVGGTKLQIGGKGARDSDLQRCCLRQIGQPVMQMKKRCPVARQSTHARPNHLCRVRAEQFFEQILQVPSPHGITTGQKRGNSEDVWKKLSYSLLIQKLHTD
jgi:hypothetical protein